MLPEAETTFSVYAGTPPFSAVSVKWRSCQVAVPLTLVEGPIGETTCRSALHPCHGLIVHRTSSYSTRARHGPRKNDTPVARTSESSAPGKEPDRTSDLTMLTL